MSSQDDRNRTARALTPEPAPTPAERTARLHALARELSEGRYIPDLDALARALLAKEPQLFGLDPQEVSALLADEDAAGRAEKTQQRRTDADA